MSLKRVRNKARIYRWLFTIARCNGLPSCFSSDTMISGGYMLSRCLQRMGIQLFKASWSALISSSRTGIFSIGAADICDTSQLSETPDFYDVQCACNAPQVEKQAISS
eukprot:m.111858 g.111858  ORF g.111858 m.111858 type:complete len:108 (+) comp51837_c0_seq3:2187-2510(+)